VNEHSCPFPFGGKEFQKERMAGKEKRRENVGKRFDAKRAQ